MTLDVEPQNVAGVLTHLGLIRGEFHATGLATTTSMHLGLDDDWVTDCVRRGDGILDGRDGTTVGDRDAERCEELFALIFEKIHGDKVVSEGAVVPNGASRVSRRTCDAER